MECRSWAVRTISSARRALAHRDVEVRNQVVNAGVLAHLGAGSNSTATLADIVPRIRRTVTQRLRGFQKSTSNGSSPISSVSWCFFRNASSYCSFTARATTNPRAGVTPFFKSSRAAAII